MMIVAYFFWGAVASVAMIVLGFIAIASLSSNALEILGLVLLIAGMFGYVLTLPLAVVFCSENS